MSMVITKFQFFEIKGEVVLGYAVMFNQSFFGPTPKPLQAININFARCKPFAVINF